jgi:hypothetical protein
MVTASFDKQRAMFFGRKHVRKATRDARVLHNHRSRVHSFNRRHAQQLKIVPTTHRYQSHTWPYHSAQPCTVGDACSPAPFLRTRFQNASAGIADCPCASTRHKPRAQAQGVTCLMCSLCSSNLTHHQHASACSTKAVSSASTGSYRLMHQHGPNLCISIFPVFTGPDWKTARRRSQAHVSVTVTDGVNAASR